MQVGFPNTKTDKQEKLRSVLECLLAPQHNSSVHWKLRVDHENNKLA